MWWEAPFLFGPEAASALTLKEAMGYPSSVDVMCFRMAIIREWFMSGLNKGRRFSSACCGLLVLAGVLVFMTTTALAGTYAISSHGTSIRRTVINAKGYVDGNCAHCHEQHASIDGAEPAPVGGAPDEYLGFDDEQNLCYGCHGSGGAGTATDNDIDNDISAGATGSHHDAASYSGKHTDKETPADISSLANKHVECTDCHNPHMARSITRTQGTNNIAATSPLYGATGIVPTFGGEWSTSYAASFTQATKEYQICFKCHSGANTNVTSWGGAGANAWTDVGLEFNTSNSSYHPVAGPISDTLNNGQLFNGWSPGDTMYCSDCHELGTGTNNAGPHGSATKWMLAGTNKAWPYDLASLNGSSSTSSSDFRNTGTSSSQGIKANYGNVNGLFCLNCHPFSTDSNPAGMDDGEIEDLNKAHGKHALRGPSDRVCACVDCHIRVPHGGRVSRLQAADRNGVMPARYWPNGNGSRISGSTWSYKDFRKQSNPTNYNDEDCYGTGDTAWDQCDKHDSSFTGERW